MAGPAATAVASSLSMPSFSSAADSPRKLRLGIIGVSNRAKSNIAGVKSQDLAAICDIDSKYLDEASKQFPEARRYTDYRQLLAQESELDGVVISTPDHHHAPAAMRAIEAGLHVYCEKPLAHTVAEVRALTNAAAAAGVKTQMGTQIHAGNNYRRVVELVRSGAIGTVSKVHVWVGKGWGATSMPAPTGSAAPDHVDWDLWQGAAPERDYTAGLHPASWRKYRDYGAGTLGDMGCHYMDLPFWALDLGYPSEIVADGPPPSEDYCPTGLKVRYRFDATDTHGDLDFHWYDGDRAPKELEGIKVPGSGVLFVGDKGMMIATYGNYTLLPAEKYAGFKPPAESIPNSIGHYEEWFGAIREDGQSLCHFGYSGPLTESVLLGTIAHRVGRVIKWNGPEAAIIGDDAASSMLTKEYRTGWEVTGATPANV